jgi:hypothetical protein
MVAATRALRAAREAYHPWYARPDRLFLLLLAVAIATAWTTSRAGAWIPQRAHGMRDSIVTWSLTLPLWLALLLAVLWFAPGAAYLWSLPLLAAAVLLLSIPPANTAAVRIVSVVVLAVSATLWLRDTLELLRFMNAVFGRLPILTPVYVYPAVMIAAAVMVAPPFIAAVAAARPLARPSIITTICLLSVAAAFGFAYAAQAYTFDQPLRRHVRALQEADGKSAVWEVGSVEPGLDLGTNAPGGWSLQSGAAPASVPWGRLPHPFVFRTSGPPLGPAPLDIVSFTVQPVAAGTELTLTAVPRRTGIAVSFVLPPGLTPARSSLPGALRLGYWTATYIAPPPDGVVFRASFPSATSGRLNDIRVVVTDAGFPGGIGWQRLPGWLPQERAVWTGAATWVIPAARPLEPVPELR